MSNLGIRHAAIAVTDLARAVDFYTRHLGFVRYHTADADWAMVQAGGTTLSLIPGEIPKKATGGSHPDHLGLTLETKEAVDALHAHLVQAAVVRVQPPKMHRDGSYGFYLHDTEGNQLEAIFIPGEAPTDQTSVVLFAHGSSDPKWREPFETLVALARRHSPHREWRMAYMERSEPTLADAITSLAATGKPIAVVPMFFSVGAHVATDVPRIVADVRKRYPELEVSLLSAIGTSTLFRQGMLDAIFALLAANDRK